MNIIAHIRFTLYRQCPYKKWEIKTRKIIDNELVLIIHGNGSVTIQGKTYTAKEGMLFYFGKDIEHSMISDENNPLHFYAIHFSYACYKYINGIWNMSAQGNPLFDKKIYYINKYIPLNEIFKSIIDKNTINPYEFQKYCNYYFLKLYYAIINDDIDSYFLYSSKENLDKCIDYINENYSRKITVTTLAHIAGYSLDYFTKLFKQYTSMTPSVYINKYKINKAKILMSESNISINELAIELGYCDQFHFSKAFKKAEGISPLSFINSHR